MTRQAVLRRLLIILSMAIDAPAHFELRDRHEISDMRIRNEMEFVEFFDRPVTRLTLDARLDVAIVSELDVLRETVDLDPLDRLLLFPVILQDSNALDLVVLGRELRMTAHTQFDRGDASGLGLIRPRVAVETIDLELTRVVFVAERNRLDGSRGLGIPGSDRGLTGAGRGPLLIELRGNLDLELRVFFLLSAQRVRIANAGRDSEVAGTRRVRDVDASFVCSGPTRPECEHRRRRHADRAKQK